MGSHTKKRRRQQGRGEARGTKAPTELVKLARLSPAWVAWQLGACGEPRTVIREGVSAGWSASIGLIWHRIWECGFGGQSQSSIKKKEGGNEFSKILKIEKKRKTTLKSNPEGKLKLLGKILSNPERDEPSPRQSLWHAVGHLGHGWHNPCGPEKPLKTGRKSERGRGRSWDHLGWEIPGPEDRKQRPVGHLPKTTS